MRLPYKLEIDHSHPPRRLDGVRLHLVLAARTLPLDLEEADVSSPLHNEILSIRLPAVVKFLWKIRPHRLTPAISSLIC